MTKENKKRPWTKEEYKKLLKRTKSWKQLTLQTAGMIDQLNTHFSRDIKTKRTWNEKIKKAHEMFGFEKPPTTKAPKENTTPTEWSDDLIGRRFITLIEGYYRKGEKGVLTGKYKESDQDEWSAAWVEWDKKENKGSSGRAVYLRHIRLLPEETTKWSDDLIGRKVEIIKNFELSPIYSEEKEATIIKSGANIYIIEMFSGEAQLISLDCIRLLPELKTTMPAPPDQQIADIRENWDIKDDEIIEDFITRLDNEVCDLSLNNENLNYKNLKHSNDKKKQLDQIDLLQSRIDWMIEELDTSEEDGHIWVEPEQFKFLINHFDPR